MSFTDTPEPITGWRRWGAYVALVVVFAIVCGLLSWWQWARQDEAMARIELVERNYDAPVSPVEELLPQLDEWDPQAEWHPVTMTGTYLEGNQLLVRNRVHSGKPGFHQLVPLQLADGRVFIIDRGWLPIGSAQDLPDVIPAVPEGEVTVEARLRPAEPHLPGRTAEQGQIPSIDVPTVIDSLGIDGWTGAYGALSSETPAVEPMPAQAAKPDADPGPHASYALQWIAFGILAFIGLVWAWRREIRIAALPREEQAAARAPKRQHDDADAEDAILDAHGR
ncbi:SURF1 family protein [Salinibacterium sp. ZJ77]|uniref:SURF1 family cytochrome oxidase biogenesis protein n=1 Tax=Salinibacterium sp. ZJ77 TaxID=2708337 RepID=UPI00141D7E60|nr:SURF1 family protein [Salinibacterium sp. ZJ77]